MKRFYFGRYVHRDSFLHHANPLVKFFSMLFVILAVGLSDTISQLGVGYFAFTLSILSAKLKFSEMWQVIRPFRFLLILTFLLQMLYDPSLEFVFPPESRTLLFSLIFTSRFLLMILFSALFTLTTSPVEIVRVFYSLAKPFAKLGLNVHDIATSMLIALRFIPLMFEEADKIITAQRLRGEWAENGSWRVILKLDSFLVPLFMRVLHYSDQIAITLRFRNSIDRVMTIGSVGVKDFYLLTATSVLLVGIYVA